MAEIAISVQDISKSYRMWSKPAARITGPLIEKCAHPLPQSWRLRRFLQERARSSYRDFWAIKGVSFEVHKGESFGIVGRNGSGKSTLLQIIARTLQPTSGAVQVHGRVAALLELGSGFNPDFTGRENVYLNGAVHGLSRSKITKIFAEIAEFADIGDFIEQPTKTYSSGMMMRLAFAVQIAVEPELLIIDEALAVGDAPFQAKCFARLRSLQSRGCTILFVSHDVGTVRSFCQNAVWLHQGKAVAQGPAVEVCEKYNRECMRAMGMQFQETQTARVAVDDRASPRKSLFLDEDNSEFQKTAQIERHGDGRVTLRNFYFFLEEKQQRSSIIRWDESVLAVYVLHSEIGYEGHFQCGLVCKTLQGQELLCCSDRTHGLRLRLAPGETRVVTMRTKLPLRAGQYIITTGIFLFPDEARFPEGTFDFTQATVADFVPFSATITIAPQFNLGIYGPVQLESQLAVHSPSQLD